MGEGIWRQVNGTCKGPGLSLNPVCLAGVGSAQARSQIEPRALSASTPSLRRVRVGQGSVSQPLRACVPLILDPKKGWSPGIMATSRPPDNAGRAG